MILIDEDRPQSLNGWSRKDPFFSLAGRGKGKHSYTLVRRRGKKTWLVKTRSTQSVSRRYRVPTRQTVPCGRVLTLTARSCPKRTADFCYRGSTMEKDNVCNEDLSVASQQEFSETQRTEQSPIKPSMEIVGDNPEIQRLRSSSVPADRIKQDNSEEEQLQPTNLSEDSSECPESQSAKSKLISDALQQEDEFLEYLMSLPAVSKEKQQKLQQKQQQPVQPALMRSISTYGGNTSSGGGAKVGLDHLDNLCKLMEQLGDLREQNSKLQKRVQYLEDLKNLQEMHKQLQEESKRRQLQEVAFLQTLQQNRQISAKRHQHRRIIKENFPTPKRHGSEDSLNNEQTTTDNNKRNNKCKSMTNGKFRQSLLRYQQRERSRSVGVEEIKQDKVVDERSGQDSGDTSKQSGQESKQQRRSVVGITGGAKAKVSKWTKVKEAFRWEKASVVMLPEAKSQDSGIGGISGGGGGTGGGSEDTRYLRVPSGDTKSGDNLLSVSPVDSVLSGHSSSACSSGGQSPGYLPCQHPLSDFTLPSATALSSSSSSEDLDIDLNFTDILAEYVTAARQLGLSRTTALLEASSSTSATLFVAAAQHEKQELTLKMRSRERVTVSGSPNPLTSIRYWAPALERSVENSTYQQRQRSLMLAGNEFQSLGRAIVKEDEYKEVRWDGIVGIVSWRERVFRLWWEERIKKLLGPRHSKGATEITIAEKSWEEFIKRLEHDITGPQRFGFKIFKNLRSEERIRQRLKIETIPTEEWTNYYKTLLDNQRDPYNADTTVTNQWNAITKMELENALTTLRNRKAPGIDGLNVELFKYGSTKLKNRLIQLLNDIWSMGRIPEDWKVSKIINIHKKNERNKCENYRGIALMSSAYKIYATILKNKLQPLVEPILQEPQCGFRKGRSCIDAVFTIKQIVEKRKEFNLPTYLLFLDYEKAYDRVLRQKLWSILNEYNLPPT
ncbi:hypothetical protein ANN_16383 [Periplaneta americana]|uniref:Reverse transcriptase domain-containing protein n=1 Tax=Periplaneta americana TaxID=6978 RepID=A0ABQ8SIU1_PERAM|nr:hypothetical protein ANN_16383 [Periplaneta americana]